MLLNSSFTYLNLRWVNLYIIPLCITLKPTGSRRNQIPHFILPLRCYETPHLPHRPHRRQIQVLGIGKMCLVWCILLILIKKRNRLRFSCISDLHVVTLAAYSV